MRCYVLSISCLHFGVQVRSLSNHNLDHNSHLENHTHDHTTVSAALHARRFGNGAPHHHVPTVVSIGFLATYREVTFAKARKGHRRVSATRACFDSRPVSSETNDLAVGSTSSLHFLIEIRVLLPDRQALSLYFVVEEDR